MLSELLTARNRASISLAQAAAAKKVFVAAVKLLIDAGADLSVPNIYGEIPLDFMNRMQLIKDGRLAKRFVRAAKIMSDFNDEAPEKLIKEGRIDPQPELDWLSLCVK